MQRSLAVDEPDSSASSQSEKPAEPPETAQILTGPPAERRPEPGSAETAPPKIQNPSEPSACDQSHTAGQVSELDPGPDPETRNRRNEESEFEEITSIERDDDPDSGPHEPAERSGIGPAGEVWSWVVLPNW